MEQVCKKRNASFDFIKVVAIYCVILGHTLLRSMNDVENYALGYLVHDIIYSFHMPLFAFVSGFFLDTSRSPLLYFKKKWNQLVLPYLSWILIFYIIPEFYHSVPFALGSNEHFYFLSFFRNIFYYIYAWGFWFVRDLFICYCIAYLGQGHFRYLYWLLTAFIMLSVNSFVFAEGTIPGEPYAGTSYLYPYFIIGKFYSDFINNERRKYIHYYIVFLFIWLMLFILLRVSEIEIVEIMKSALLFIQKVSACIGLTLFISLVLPKYINTRQSFLFNKMCNVGQYTLGIYILQDFISSFCYIGYTFGGIYRIIYDALYSCFILLLCYGICKIISKYKNVSFLLGK